MMHWAARVILKPYEAGASGPDSFDCVGLVRYYFKEVHGIGLPDYELATGTRRQLLEFIRSTGWHRAEGLPAADDVVLMENLFGERHVGVMIEHSEGLQLLHAQGTNAKGSVICQPLNTLVGYRNFETWRKPK